MQMQNGWYEIRHKNPIWMNPEDAKRIGVETGDLARVETEIGHFVDSGLGHRRDQAWRHRHQPPLGTLALEGRFRREQRLVQPC